ncbi:MAG: hypothetical protein ABI588_07205 [Arenimonas sp.]
MNLRLWCAAASALLFCACSGNGTRDGMVYRDGSWYAPAGEGRGDYYTSSPRAPDAIDYPYDFGIGLVPFAGYCPVRYRYCSSFWSYDPFYDPYWAQPWIYYRPPSRPHRPRQAPLPGGVVGEEVEPAPARGARQEQPRPQSRDERPMRTPQSRESDGEPRQRRRPNPADGGPR